jgi:hypothetical protein
VQADVAASNGVIHAIDRVLIPPRKVASLRAEASGGRKVAGAFVLSI